MRMVNLKTAGVVAAGILLLTGPSAFLCGCKPSAKKLAEREQALNQEIEGLLAKIKEQQALGQLAPALEQAKAGLANPAYKAHRSRFFTCQIELLLAQEQCAAAEDLVLGAWKAEPPLAQAVFGWIHNHYQQKNNAFATLSWCKRLLELGPALPADKRSQVLGWRLSSALALADAAAAQAGVDDIVSLLPPEEGAPLLQSTLTGLIGSGQHALVTPLVARIREKSPDAPAYRQLAAALSLRTVIATGDWPRFPAAFAACVDQLPDDALYPLTRQSVYPALQKNNRKDLVEQSAQLVIATAAAKTNSVNLASRLWVECGVAADKKQLPVRLEALLKANVSPVQVGNLFDRHFYDMVSELDIIRSLCSLGERILAVCGDETTVNNLKVKILDGAFITENYDLAVQMLEQGFPGKDKLWHDMSLPKVKAHRALAQKNPRDAVKYFREFMNCWISSKQEEEYDPTSGIAYSREWILGRNANRIANILDSIPDKAEADKAREEAKGYFRVAVKKAAADAEATKLILEETKGMGL